MFYVSYWSKADFMTLIWATFSADIHKKRISAFQKFGIKLWSRNLWEVLLKFILKVSVQMFFILFSLQVTGWERRVEN